MYLTGFLSSVAGVNSNPFQPQIDTLKNSQVSDESNISTIQTNISNLTSQITTIITNLSNQVTKENTDFTNINSAYTLYSTNNDNRLTTDETQIALNKNNININTTDISSLQSDNVNNKQNISTNQLNISSLQSNNSTNQLNITANTNSIININNKLIVDETNLNQCMTDISNIKTYDNTNTSNLATINNNILANTNSINLINSSTISNLGNVYLPINNPVVTGTLTTNTIDCSGNLSIGSSSNVINLGTNTQISNKTITLNEGEIGNNQSGSCGILFKDNDIENQGYIMNNVDSTQILIKPCQNANVFSITSNPTNFYDLTTKLYVDSKDSGLQTSITNLLNQVTNVNNEISTINSTMVSKPTSGSANTYMNGLGLFTVPANSATVTYTNINNFPSDNLNVLLGDGTYDKISNNQITDHTINPTKLIVSGVNTQYLNGSGSFSIPNPTIAYTNINTFPSDNLHVLLGDGTNSKVTNNLITNNTIDPLKLTSNFVTGAYLNSSGIFTVPPLFNNFLHQI